MKARVVEQGMIDWVDGDVIRVHGPYREGGPRLVTVRLKEPVLVSGKIISRYTLPLDVWESRRYAA